MVRLCEADSILKAVIHVHELLDCQGAFWYSYASSDLNKTMHVSQDSTDLCKCRVPLQQVAKYKIACFCGATKGLTITGTH